MLTASQTAAGASFACLVAAAAWLAMSEFPIADPGRPSTSADALRILEAAVPAIGPYSSFDVNDENPFIPWQLRVVETKTRQQPPIPAGKTKPPVAKPPVVDEPVRPALPRLAAPGANGPAATGIVISKDGPQALLTFPGEKNARVLKPGDSANGWSLVEITGGNVARVKQDATGTVVNLVIPENLAPPKAAEDKAGAKDKAGKAAGGKDQAGKGQAAKDQTGKEQGGKPAPASAPEGRPAPQPPVDGAPRPAEPHLPPRPDKMM